MTKQPTKKRTVKKPPKNKGGRPTDYNDKTISKAEKYLSDCPDALPSVVGLAIYLEVTTKTIYNWSKVEGREKFLHTLEKIQDAQHKMALNKGITGAFNSTITKLVLANHGYHEKTESDITIRDKDPSKRKSRIEELLSKTQT